MKSETVLKMSSQTALSDLISEAMDEQGVSINDLAEKLDMTYEHTRRIVRGEGTPSKLVLKAVCALLNINFEDAEKLSVAAKIKKKYGVIPMEIAGKNPELEPVERAWPNLTSAQKADAISMIQGWAKRNKAAK